LSKAVDIGKVSAKGSFNLLWGLVASTVISAVGTIFVARLLAPSEYGIYTIALTAPNLISNFTDWGVGQAMVRYIALYNSEGKTDSLRNIVVSGLVFKIILSLLLSLVSFFLSASLATVFHRPQIVSLIQIASLIILAQAFVGIAQGTFIGIERMELYSVTQIIFSTVKTILIPALVIIGMGVLGAVMGYTLTSYLSGLTGLALLWMLYKGFVGSEPHRWKIIASIKTMLKYGLPISISNMLGAFLGQFWSFLLPIFANDILIGNYSVANNFVVLVTFFSTPITTVMFPAFAKLDGQKDRETLKNVYQFSVKYAALLVVPAAFLLMVLSQPAVSILFGYKYTFAPLFLALLSAGYIITAFGSLSNGNLIMGQGKTKFMLKVSLILSAMGFPIGFILISQFGVIGLPITSNIVAIPIVIIELLWLKKNYGATIDLASSGKIILSSGIAASVTYSFVYFTAFSSLAKLIIGIVIFVFTFVPAALLTRALTVADINNLRGMVPEIRHFHRLFNFVLNLLEKLVNAL
jgi:O-antigen/teichoic acid export membrane protein